MSVCSCGKVYPDDQDPHQWTPPEKEELERTKQWLADSERTGTRLEQELGDLAAELESGAPDGWDGDWARDRAAALRTVVEVVEVVEVAEHDRDAAIESRDYWQEEAEKTRAALGALADQWDRELTDEPEVNRAAMLFEAVAALRALLDGDTSALDKRLAEEREQIAQAMEGPPVYRTRNEAGDVMIPLADAQRVARAGGTP